MKKQLCVIWLTLALCLSARVPAARAVPSCRFSNQLAIDNRIVVPNVVPSCRMSGRIMIDNRITGDPCDVSAAFPLDNRLCPEGQTCDDGQICTVNDVCSGGTCAGATIVALYGDVSPSGGDGNVDVGDILLLLDAFSGAVICPECDLSPCGGDGNTDVGDILAVLDAFSGIFACPHPCPPLVQ